MLRSLGKMAVVAGLLALGPAAAAAQATSPPAPVKVIVDQDARGPATTDLQSILVFLQSPHFDVLGVTIVTGDQWLKEETAHTLRMLELIGRADVPVYEGAEFPLLRTREETLRWEALYGGLDYMGAFGYGGHYHEPGVVPPLPEGAPHTKPRTETAAHFMIRMVHQYPGQVLIWEGGPMTNLALAIRLDPDFARLAKGLVFMGGGFYGHQSGVNNIDGRREFNWWFDPEAVQIVLRAPWRHVTMVPLDPSVEVPLTPAVRAAIARAHTPISEYLTRYSSRGFMYDELAAAILIDPGIVARRQDMYVGIVTDSGAGNGLTVYRPLTEKVPPYMHPVDVVLDVHPQKLYDLYVKLMTANRGNTETP